MYNELYKAWKIEKTTHMLQSLPSEFYDQTANYLNGLPSLTENNTMQSRLQAKEAEIAKRLLQELRETRLQKIVNAAKYHETNTELLEDEMKLALGIRESLTTFMQGREPREQEQPTLTETKAKLTVVRFLQDIPEIIGVDLKIYGPYKKEDVATLPPPNAHALVKQMSAKVIEIRSVESA